MEFYTGLLLLGYRLKSEILKTFKTIAKVLCVVSCVEDPCCRSVNFKRNSSNEGNDGDCELLHDVDGKSSSRLEKDTLYEHIHLLEPQKVKRNTNRNIKSWCTATESKITVRYKNVTKGPSLFAQNVRHTVNLRI